MASIVYLSHGGGPLPVLGEPGHVKMVEFMKELPSLIERPDAIIVISAHWEEREATVTGHPSPPLVYDYYGFPPEAYTLTYPVKGNPSLAKEVADLLESSAIPFVYDEERGLDHGTFIPLLLSYPDASIPTIQLSLVRGLDPSLHYDIGKALQPLGDKNILVIGSGFSFHNMREFIWDGTNPPDERNDVFQEHLIQTFTGNMSSEELREAVTSWKSAPHARYCHPREEHLVPVFVCAGISDGPAELIFDDRIMGKRAIALKWQMPAEK